MTPLRGGKINGMRKILIVLALLILGAATVGIRGQSTEQSKPTPSPTTNAESKVSLTVNTGQGEFNYELEGVVGKTALEATAKATDGELVAQGEGEMAFITEIKGREAKTENREFWELVVNGEPAQVGAGSYVVQPGDSIEWRISTY